MQIPFYPFLDVVVIPTTGYLQRALQWRIDPAFSDSGPFNFSLQASETPSFSEIIFSKDVGNTFYAIDDTKIHQTHYTAFYYRIKLTTGSNKTYYSQNYLYFTDGEDVKPQYLVANEIVRKEFVRMRFTGQIGWILKRKNYSEVNKEKVSPITGVPLYDDLSTYGTGKVDGYHDPLKIMFSLEDWRSESSLEPGGAGVVLREESVFRFVGFPIITAKDVIVTTAGTRYFVEQANSTFMPGTNIPIVQMCPSKLAPLTDPIYNIKIE